MQISKNNLIHDDIIHNIKKIADKYQEILFYLMQGKGNLVPKAFINNEKCQTLLVKFIEQMIKSPDEFISLQLKYYNQLNTLMTTMMDKFLGNTTAPSFVPNKHDKRFLDQTWQDNAYFNFIKQFYLMSSEFVHENIELFEIDKELKQYLEFLTQQFINAMSPTNFVLTNPKVLKESFSSGWQNIVDGMDNFLEDLKRSEDVLHITMTDKSKFKIGKNIAATKGKVIYQNELIELICYEPKEQAHSIPILILPPWINKYYILDLSNHNSLVSFLVENNFQVFLVSWVNPDEKLSHKNFEDYLKEGVLDPCEHINKLGYNKINFLGYCISGTLLSIALAYMKTKDLSYVNSATFLTTLLDFTHPGEIGVFINNSIITNIEAEMKQKGYFDGRYLSNSFSLLRANDLVWSFFINNYLLGKTPIPFDILYWNMDATNLPETMHSYYLRNLYLNNKLKEPNSLKMLNTNIDLGNIDCKCFFLAAADDHIAPWRSVYDGVKLLKNVNSQDKIFCLTSSGHVAGVVNPPSKPETLSKRHYKLYSDLSLENEDWFLKAKEHKGSWWPYWCTWLKEISGPLENNNKYHHADNITPAPGKYVFHHL